MAKAIMIQGTTSNAGKSLLAAGLCRIFRQDGYSVAPFKSQNMALNSFVTADGLEMGRAQVMQAECAGIPPDVRMNPILLKPNSNTGSQVIVNGEVVGNMTAVAYFAYKNRLVPDVMRAYESLAAEHDIIVLEGAGSPAEINLKQQDIVNMGMARMAKAPVLLVGDINPGGVFAALAGTAQLLEPDEREMLKGVIINKFRGDRSILAPGLAQLQEIIHKPVLGVVPYLDLDVDDEDSLSHRLNKKPQETAAIDIAVIRLPRMSNFTDFAALDAVAGVRVRYVGSVREWGNPDLIILPGTKNTMGDLLWLRQSGMERKIMKHAMHKLPVFGVCGGYQMLGTVLHDPLEIEHGGTMAGLGLLEMETTFTPRKHRRQVQGQFGQVPGIFVGLSQKPFSGYEVHMGESESKEGGDPLCHIALEGKSYVDGRSNGNIYGCYIHGIFDCAQVAKTIIAALMAHKGMDPSNVQAMDAAGYKEIEYNKLADALRESLDLNRIYQIMDAGIS